jgi:hypothetical protein
MTVEYETNDSGIFIDTRLNITPVSHENPNGFVYIIDMPAKLWGGPDHIETTTLHEYRWHRAGYSRFRGLDFGAKTSLGKRYTIKR